MRINKVQLSNFRNHADTRLELERLTIIRGPNHSGKSSIAQAIEYALTGRCEGTDARGAGAVELISKGADKAAIALAIQANREVIFKCTLTPASGRQMKVAAEDVGAWKWIESQRGVLSCVLNTRHFINLPEREQKNLLAAVILPDTFTLPADIEDALKDAGLRRFDGGDAVQYINCIYEAAFSKRRDVARDLKNHAVPPALDTEIPADWPPLKDVKDELSVKRNTRDAQEKRARDLAAGRARLETKLEALRAKVQTLEARKSVETQTLAGASKGVLGTKKLSEVKKIIDRETEVANARERWHDLSAKRNGLEDQLEEVSEHLRGKSECPTCHRAVSPEILSDITATIKAKFDLAFTEAQQAADALKALPDLEDAKRSLAEHNAATTSRNRSQALIAEMDTDIGNAEQEITAVSAELDQQPESARDAQDQTRARILELEHMLDRLAGKESRESEIEAAKIKHKRLEEMHAKLETLVAYFGPDGIKAQLLAGHVKPFTDKINDVLAAWDYQVDLRFEPYAVQVGNNRTGVDLPLHCLSESEKWQFSVAFQVALASVTNIRMVVIDEAEILDGAGRCEFYQRIHEADIDQAITIGTDEREYAPEASGCVCYAMRDGVPIKLEPMPVEEPVGV